jgi:hypothetical protein
VRRRTFLAGSALALAAPGAAVAAPRTAGEAGVLAAAVELEQLASYVYDAGVKSALLDEDGVAAIGGMREQEQEHADALAALLEALGGPRPKPPATPEDADAALERLGIDGRLTGVRTQAAFLALAEEIELREIGLYVGAVSRLGDVRLIQTVASILGAEGAHLVVIRRALGRAPVPVAVESGRA